MGARGSYRSYSFDLKLAVVAAGGINCFPEQKIPRQTRHSWKLTTLRKPQCLTDRGTGGKSVDAEASHVHTIAFDVAPSSLTPGSLK